MAGALHVPEQHDLDEAPDVQGVGRRVEPDVAGNPAGDGGRVQRFEVGALVDVAALDEGAEQNGAKRCRCGRGCGGHGEGEGRACHRDRGSEIFGYPNERV